MQAELREREVILQAGGVRVVLSGPLATVQADHPVRLQQRIAHKDYLVFSLILQAREDTLVQDISWFKGDWDSECETVVSSTRMQDNVLFVRKNGISFFLSLDFPYSRIQPRQGISYPAHARMKAQATLNAHTLSVGACRLSGVRVGNLDRAEIEAVSAYVETRFPQRFKRPMFLAGSIRNRYGDPREGRIFYTMRDNPTLFLSPDLLAEDVRLMSKLGVEYYQLFEGLFDWPDARKNGAALRKLVRLGNRLGVRIGDYLCGRLFCPHYNYPHKSYLHLVEQMGKPRWIRINAKGEKDGLCMGDHEYADYLIRTMVDHNRKFGERLLCLDMWSIVPCHAKGHDHAPGDVYQQVAGLVRLMQALNAISPDFLVWTNIGIFDALMPKLAWFNPNCYLTDPHMRQYAPTLNALKLLGDSRREQMVSLHDQSFVPWRNYTNYEYYISPGSRVHDLEFFEYSFLQGLAVTPNIGLGEARSFLNRVPSGKREYCESFMRRWMDFIRKQFHIWKHTARVGDAPGLGKAEIYAHMLPDHGYLCLINPNPFPQTVRFRLDGSIGLSRGSRLSIHEIYPQQCLIAEQPLPYAAHGSSIECALAPHSVRYLEIRPYRSSNGVRLYGLPARVRRTADGYRVLLRGPQGVTRRLGLVLPKGAQATSVSAQHAPTVPMFTFPAGAKLVAKRANAAFVDVTFPREPAPRALTQWTVAPGNIRVNLPASDQDAFLGALVHGAFTEDMEVQVDLAVGLSRKSGVLAPPPMPATKSPSRLPKRKRYVFRTEFELPFIERRGMAPRDEEPVVELAFSDMSRVSALSARINGKPAIVQRHCYGDWYTPYVELMGAARPGKVLLEIGFTVNRGKKTAKD